MKPVHLVMLVTCLLACTETQARPTVEPLGSSARQFNSVEAYLSRIAKDKKPDGDSSKNSDQSKGRSLRLLDPLDLSVQPLGYDRYSSSGNYKNDGYSGGYRTNGYQTNGYQSGGYQTGGYQTGGYQTGGYQTGGYSDSYTNGYKNRYKYLPIPYEVYTLLDPEIKIIKSTRVNSNKAYAPIKTVVTFGDSKKEFTSIGKNVYEPELVIQEESIVKPFKSSVKFSDSSDDPSSLPEQVSDVGTSAVQDKEATTELDNGESTLSSDPGDSTDNSSRSTEQNSDVGSSAVPDKEAAVELLGGLTESDPVKEIVDKVSTDVDPIVKGIGQSLGAGDPAEGVSAEAGADLGEGADVVLVDSSEQDSAGKQDSGGQQGSIIPAATTLVDPLVPEVLQVDKAIGLEGQVGLSTGVEVGESGSVEGDSQEQELDREPKKTAELLLDKGGLEVDKEVQVGAEVGVDDQPDIEVDKS